MFEGWSVEMVNFFGDYFMTCMSIILFMLLILPVIAYIYGRDKK